MRFVSPACRSALVSTGPWQEPLSPVDESQLAETDNLEHVVGLFNRLKNRTQPDDTVPFVEQIATRYTELAAEHPTLSNSELIDRLITVLFGPDHYTSEAAVRQWLERWQNNGLANLAIAVAMVRGNFREHELDKLRGILTEDVLACYERHQISLDAVVGRETDRAA